MIDGLVGNSLAGTYTVTGGKLILTISTGSAVFAINRDGSLDGETYGLTGHFVKQSGAQQESPQQSSAATDFETDRIDNGRAVMIHRYLGSSGTVVIPPRIQNLPVTTINTVAFDKKNLTSVVIPTSVTSIYGSAFSGNQLTSVVIPDSVTSIGGSAFRRNQLTSITIGANVTWRGGPSIPSFDNGFDAFYDQNGKKAGTYTFNNGAWSAVYR
jgi:hypothetical protein